MSFLKSKLFQKISDGELPEVRTEVSVSDKSLVNIGILVLTLAVGIAALVMYVKRNA